MRTLRKRDSTRLTFMSVSELRNDLAKRPSAPRQRSPRVLIALVIAAVVAAIIAFFGSALL